MDWDKYDKKRVITLACVLAAILIILIIFMRLKGVFWFFGGITFLAACAATGRGEVGLEFRLIAAAVAVVSGLIAYLIGSVVFD